MAHYLGTIPTRRGVEDAFDYMADFSSVAAWDPSVVRASALGPPGPGAKFEVVVRFAGRELPFTYETVAYERPDRLVLRAESSTVISEDTVTVRPVGGGAEITYSAQLTAKGLLRIADPVLGSLLKRLGDNAAAGLARELSR